jgi:hypothetical protein
MINLITYLERIDQHFNINSNFLINRVRKERNIFDAIDELYIFVKSIDYINEALEKNNIKDRVSIVFFDSQNSEYDNLIKDFINKKIYRNQLKDKIVEYYSKNKDFNKKIKRYVLFKNKGKDDFYLDEISRSLYPKNISLDFKFKNKNFSISPSFGFMNFKSYFNQYHDLLFHLLSEPDVVEKFTDLDTYGSFTEPSGYTPEEILKELFSLQTNSVSPSGEDIASFHLKYSNYNFFEKLSSYFEKQNYPLTWKKFREVFINYPKLLRLFPINKYPDEDYFIKRFDSFKDDKIKVTPGSTKKIIKQYQISPDSFQGTTDKIKNFEGEIAFVLKRTADLIDKIKRENNNIKYIKELFKDPKLVELFN